MNNEKQKTIIDLMSKIRNHISRLEKRNTLTESKNIWCLLCSALDLIEDTTSAVQYYLTSDFPSAVSGQYLYIYGLLQAVFLQQDAACSISIALFNHSIDYKEKYPKVYEIREMRNDTIGHPTTRNNGKSFINISQISICKNGFQYIKSEKVNKFQPIFISVDLKLVIDENEDCIIYILEDVSEKLDEEYKAYLKLNRERKMADIFSQLSYAEEKALSNDVMKKWGIQQIQKIVDKCKYELNRRFGSWETVDSWKYILEQIADIQNLYEQLHLEPIDNKEKIINYLLELVFIKLHKMQDYSIEMDSDFEEKGDFLNE